MALDIGLKDIGLTVGGALLGAIIPESAKHFRRWRTLRLLSRVFPTVADEGGQIVIHIRPSFDAITFGENPPTLRGYTHAGDLEAVMDIHGAFEHLPVKLEFDYFPEISREMKNVIIVGASSRSDTARELGQELYAKQIRIHGERRHAFYRDSSGVEYKCAHRKRGDQWLVTKDVGIIYRSQTDLGAIILLCAGIHTFGSQAATEVALLPEFQKRVRASGLRQFVQFVTVDVVSSGARAGLGMVRQSIRWQDLPLEPV